MKLFKLSAVIVVITFFTACNTDRPYKIVDVHQGTPTNADTVLYNLHHEEAVHEEAVHGEAAHGEAAAAQEHHNQNENLPRVFWR